MHSNAETLNRFYEAFGRRDAEAMAACYHADVRFSDPVFPDLRGDEARAMWRMLCEAGKDLAIEASGIEAGDRNGKAHWEARYTFSGTGRKVHNVIDAEFTFDDSGLITEHRDRFSMWRWSRQALGAPGLLLGWTPLISINVRKRAGAQLRAYMAR